MKFRFLSLLALVISATSAFAAENDDRVYEMRVYYAAEGKLERLHTRFRDHTTKLFEKHGMTNVGYWTPIENPDRKLIYVLAYPSREAAREVVEGVSGRSRLAEGPPESEARRPAGGQDRIDVPAARPTIRPRSSRRPGRRPRLRAADLHGDERQSRPAQRPLPRSHTEAVREARHDERRLLGRRVKEPEGADDTLIYILAHKSVDAAKASFDAFRKDPDWIKAKGESEREGGRLADGQGRRQVGILEGDRLLADSVEPPGRRELDRRAIAPKSAPRRSDRPSCRGCGDGRRREARNRNRRALG